MQPRTRNKLTALGITGVSVAAVVFSMPPVLQLGTLVRLVVFHGASTWVNLVAFTLAGVSAALFILTSRPALLAWARSARYFSAALWVTNTGLGLLSSRLAWGSIDFSEPRLRATFWILLGAALVIALDLTFAEPRLTALGDAGLATAVWALILTAPNVVHPDNPVLNSGWEIKGPFFAIVAGIALMSGLAIALIRGRLEPRS